MSEITIRALRTVSEMQRAVELQTVYWGTDMSDLVPEHMLLSIARAGGHVHGAFDGELMVGMLLGFLGADIDPDDDLPAHERLYVMSKRMVVLPEYRGHKIGERLKWVQRDFALGHHIRLVQWTFDPLLARNAYLNLHKLGAVIQQYKEDYFGAGASHPTLQADRLVANWWVEHPHVAERERGDRDEAMLHGTIANRTTLTAQGLIQPIHYDRPYEATVLLEIPKEFVPLERINPALGQDWRDHVRAAFQDLLSAGYIAVDLVLRNLAPTADNTADELERAFYVFVRDDGTFGF